MSSISAVGGSGDAWAAMRSQMQARMFAKSDSNSDGGVDKTELSSMLSDISRMTGQKLDGNIDDTFKAMDGNGDGTLSSEELGKGMEKLMPPPSTMDFAQTRSSSGSASSSDNKSYDPLDTNKDGTVSKFERLIGELKSASADTSSSQDIAQFAQKMYEKFAQGLSQRVQGSNLSAVA